MNEEKYEDVELSDSGIDYDKDSHKKKKSDKVKKKVEEKVENRRVKNKLHQKIILNFPLGRSLTFKSTEIKELTQEEIDSSYFQNRKNYFMIIGGE